MKVDEFISGVCGWGPDAPVKLRGGALENGLEWRSYSTAQFLDCLQETKLSSRRRDGLSQSVCPEPFSPSERIWRVGNNRLDENPEPSALPAKDVAESRICSEICIELLPPLVTKRWQSIGLRFATESDIREMKFVETLAKSFDLIKLVSPFHGTVAGLCRTLHVLLVSSGSVDICYSEPTLPFSIFVSCPPITENSRVERLAENVIHEALHLQLSLVERYEPLVRDKVNDELVYSPWKKSVRTVHGLLHAMYVFSNLRYFWSRVAAKCPNVSSFAQNRIDTINQEMRGARKLQDSPLLTVAGQRLAASSIIL